MMHSTSGEEGGRIDAPARRVRFCLLGYLVRKIPVLPSFSSSYSIPWSLGKGCKDRYLFPNFRDSGTRYNPNDR